MSLKLTGKVLSGLALSMLITGTAVAAIDTSKTVDMLSPANNGAFVTKLGGLVSNKKIATLKGTRTSVNDGIVIRASKIEDGKIIIPAGGMYTTSRCGNWHSFEDHIFTAAGKDYHFITDEYQQDVVRNVTLKPGEMVYGNEAKTRGWQLTYLGKNPYGVDGTHGITLKIVKTTGNYYGNPFNHVFGNTTPDNVCDGTLLKNGSGAAKATTSWEEQPYPFDHFSGNSISNNNRSYVILESATPEEVKVKELVTVSTKKAVISPNAPMMGVYGVGDMFKIGNASVKVTAVGADNATIEVTDAKGTVTKTIGIKAEDRKIFPSSRVVAQGMMVMSASGSESVNINYYKEGGFIVDGKVALMAYSDVMSLNDGDAWTDPNYIVRPEICAECTFIHELVIQNDKPIVLDAKNNVAVGPNGYWKVVIDEFDGKTVKAWHIETAKDKTGNLAGRAKGKHIDAVVGDDCRSTAHFFSRVYAQLYKEAMAQ